MFDNSQLGLSDTRVRRRLSNVSQHQNVPADRDASLRSQLQRSEAPPDQRYFSCDFSVTVSVSVMFL